MELRAEHRRWAFWLWGPALGLLLLAAAVLTNSESHYFVLSFIAALGFGFIAPLVQLLLVYLPHFRGRRQATVTAAFLAVAALVGAAFLAGAVYAAM